MTTSPRARQGRKAGRGILVILALFLAASGALRLGSGLGEALARTEAGGPDPAGPLDCPLPSAALLDALQDREAQVAAQEAAAADRRAALALAEAAIVQRLAELRDAEERLAATLNTADGAAEADLARLTEVYETMKPKVAAGLFAAMAPEFAAGFLGRMRPDAAAAILSGMEPNAAYTVSALLAARHSNVPKN
ncbi:MAG: MotE family protein [Pseudorhodobacter sp.]